MEKADVAVIGAGLAGLTCAQQLRQSGYQVIVLEKSRGLGGRAATRRLLNTCADHGLRYLDEQGIRSRQWIDRLLREGVISSWTEVTHTLDASGQITVDVAQHRIYVAPMGMSAIAKELAIDLDIRRSQRVVKIFPTSEGWQFEIESESTLEAPLVARSLVIAIPAPQALALLDPLAKSQETDVHALAAICNPLRSVQFDPCLTTIAVYPEARLADSQALIWKALTLEDDPVLRWIGLDSSKRPNAKQPIFVLHSNAAFAEQCFEASDLQSLGQQMLDRAAQRLIPWLNAPELFQIHRWRYAFVRQFLPEFCLVGELPLPMVYCGEGCGGQGVEAALVSGAAAANQLEKIHSL